MTTSFTPDPRDLEAPGASSTGRDPLLAKAARYAKWDGTQTIPALDADEILEAMADDVMSEGDLSEALRRLMERGWHTSDPTRHDLAGLNELRAKLVGLLQAPAQKLVMVISAPASQLARVVEARSKKLAEGGAA